ncbi:MAG TPA: META domain-containing protein [Candidatus Saccharimonadia bacterium]|nr:META domain-containing protein [Candidatus Saccharimonadia bacterium]
MRTIPRFAALMLTCAASACASDAGGAADAAAPGAPDASRGSWVARSLRGAEGPPRMALGDGKVRGHTGCNGFSATYARAADGSITFGAIVSSKKFCEGEAGRSEQRVLRALAAARRATIVGDTLTLRDAAGVALLAWKRAR